MKIGLLQCDDVRDELQSEFGNYPEMFEKLFAQIVPDWQLCTYRVLDGELPESVDACDGYITTGSRYGVNDGYPWISQLETFVASLASQEVKFVGICFGHQLLAKALQGEVELSERGWGVGMSSNHIKARAPWMEPYQSSLNLVVSHQDQVTHLPEGAKVLAGSDFCPYYMVQYNPYLMSVQGHPEFNKSYSSALMELRKGIIPAPRIREGQASLSAPVDDRLMMQWIANFFIEEMD